MSSYSSINGMISYGNSLSNFPRSFTISELVICRGCYSSRIQSAEIIILSRGKRYFRDTSLLKLASEGVIEGSSWRRS